MAINDDLKYKVEIDSKDAQKKLKNLQKRLKGLQASVDSFSGEVKKSADALDDMSGEANQSDSALKRLAKTINDAAKDYSDLGMVITGVNQAMELGSRIAAQVGNAIGKTAGNFANLETAIVGVAKTTDLTAFELGQLVSEMTALSSEIPVATSELLGFAQIAGQLGVKGQDNLANFAETIAKVGVATDLAGEQAATAFTRILNVTNTNIDQIDEFASVMVALGNNFAATESEIARMTNEVARSTAVFGVSADEAAAYGTALKALGQQAQLGGSVLGKLLRTLKAITNEGGGELEKLNNFVGMTGDQFKEKLEKDASGAVFSFLESLGKIQDKSGALEQFGLIGDEVNKVLPALSTRTDILADALSMAANEMQNATALSNEASKAFDTLSSDFNTTINSLTDLGSTVGSVLAPAFRVVLNTVTVVADAMRNLIEFSKPLIAVLGAAGLVATLKLLGNQFLYAKASALDFAGALGKSPFQKFGAGMENLTKQFIDFFKVGDLMKSVLSGNIKGVVTWVGALTKSFAKLFLMLAKNPFTWIVLGLTATVHAVMELDDEINILGKSWAVFAGEAEKADKAIDSNRKQLTLWQKIMNTIKGTIVVLTEAFFRFTGWVSAKMGVFDGFSARAKKFADELDVVARKLRKEIRSGREIEKVGTGIDGATGSAEGLNKALDKTADDLLRLADLGKKLDDEFTALSQVEAFGGGDLAKSEAAFNMERAKTALIKQNILLSKMESSEKQKALDKVSKAEDKLFKLKNFQQQLAVEKQVNQIQAKTLGIKNQIAKAGLDIKMANAGTFEKIELQYEYQQKILDQEIGIIDQKIKAEKIALKNLRDANATTGVLKKQKKIIEQMNKLKGETSKKKGALDNQKGQDLQQAGIDMASGFVGAAKSGAQALGQKMLTEYGPKFVNMIGKKLGAALGPFAGIITEILSLLSGGYDKMYQFAQGILEFLFNLPKNIMQGLRGLIEGVVDFFTNMFSDPKVINGMINGIATAIPNALTKAFKAIPKILKNLLSLKFWSDILKNFVDAFVDSLVEAWHAFMAIFTGDFGSSITEAFTEGVKGAADSLMGFSENLFSVVADTAGLMGGDSGSTLGDEAQEIGFNIWQAFIDALVAGWHWILQIGEKIWEGLKNMAGDIWSFFKDAGMAIWDGLKGMASGLGDMLKNAFLGAWDALKSAFSNIGTIMWDAIKGIGDKIKGMFSKFFDIPSGGTGTVEGWLRTDIPFLNFAEGGTVPNTGNKPMARGNSYSNDVIPAMLSPDEFVLPRSVTQDDTKMGLIDKVLAGEIGYFSKGWSFGEIVENTTSSASDAGNKVVSGGSEIIHDIGEATGVNSVLEAGESAIAGLSDTLTSVWNWLEDNLGSLGAESLAAFTASPRDFVSSVISSAMGNFMENSVGSIFEGAINAFHTGGMIGNDGVANVLGGEFVMNRQAVQSIGAENLGNLNRGGTGSLGNNLTMGDINVTIMANDTNDIDGQQLANDFIDELKNRSLRGEFVLSSKGIR